MKQTCGKGKGGAQVVCAISCKYHSLVAALLPQPPQMLPLLPPTSSLSHPYVMNQIFRYTSECIYAPALPSRGARHRYAMNPRTFEYTSDCVHNTITGYPTGMISPLLLPQMLPLSPPPHHCVMV